MSLTPYFDDGTVSLYLGDCRTVLAEIPDASVDAIVTDPPYNLSPSGKRDLDCLRRVISQIHFPDHQERDRLAFESGELTTPSGGVPSLNLMHGTVRVSARVGMPEGAIHLQSPAVVQQKIDDANEASSRSSDSELPSESDLPHGEYVGHYVLQLAAGGDSAFCDGTCRCFTEPRPGLLAVNVALACATARDSTGDLLGGGWGRDQDVRLLDDAGSQPEGASSVVAGAGAVVNAVLSLDLSRRTGDLRLADGAHHDAPLFELIPAQLVGACTGAGGLSSVSETGLVSLVGGPADRAFSLHFPWHALNPSRQAQGFMGKEWDGWESPASFQRWCLAWARECLRVLKPGGYLLAFGGTRTWHRLVCAIEDAGFEIRDSTAALTGQDAPGLIWTYGSGFPKSHDVSKAIDKAAGAEREVLGPGQYSMRGRRTDNRVYGEATLSTAEVITAPATDDAARWEGWGTALKPAWEPIAVARKPLVGTVVANVLEYGTGALNINACRTAVVDLESYRRNASGHDQNRIRGSEFAMTAGSASEVGRWPTNLVFTHSAACVEDGACAEDCPVAELDRQSGVGKTNQPGTRSAGGQHGTYSPIGAQPRSEMPYYGDTGGASRFFPVFRYEAKAPASERPKLADGTAHTTVKPLALMRFLARLVCPPGGLVLDPFAGSGTTGEACVIEGFRSLLIEQDPAHAELIKARLTKPIQPTFGEVS